MLSEFDKERIRYSMNMLLNEAEKIVVLVLQFGVVGQLDMFVLSFMVLMSLRAFVGGMHFTKRWQCFLFTLLFFVVVIVSSKIVLINQVTRLLIGGLALINIVFCAPLPSRHRILVLERGRDILRKRAVITMFIWIVVSVMLSEKLSNVIVWTITMQQFEILYYQIIFKRKEEKYHED